MEKKILLVDDEVDFVEITKVALENKGYQVVVAYDGKEALNMVQKEKPDLIILDVMMATKTEGFDVSREIRKQKEFQNTPIIMLTAIRERMDVKWKIQPDKDWLPVTEFMEKPIPPEKLIEKIEEMLKSIKK